MRKFIEQHQNDDIRRLAFQASNYPDLDIKTAVVQIQGRQITKRKIPSWFSNQDIIYPPHLSMEQCSSELTAIYKSSLCEGNFFTDLTGGLGVDFAFMSRRFRKAVYVEKESYLFDIAQYNFKVLSLDNVSLVCNDAVNYLANMQQHADLIYLDPARRKLGGGKAFLLEDCVPNVIVLDTLLNEKSDKVFIKLSPMLDISKALLSLSYISDVYVISVMNECKELLFIKNNRNDAVRIHCVNIKNEKAFDYYTFLRSDEENLDLRYTTGLGKYLYEPNSSIMKAGAYKSVANQYSLLKLHPNSHLYTSDIYDPDFQGRVFCIDKVSSLSKDDLRHNFSTIKQSNVVVRNFPMSAEALKAKLKVKDGGECFVFATTLADEKKVLLLCRKL